MKLIKRITLSVVATMTIATQSNAIFGVGDVVYDPAAVYQAIEQVTQLKKQYDQMKKTTAAVMGVKDAVKMYKDIKTLTNVMQEYKITLDDLDIDNPKSKIGVMAKEIFEENQIFDNCDSDCSSDLQKKVCKNKQIANVTEIATAMVFSEELDKTAKRLQDLSKKLANSKTLKASQDIGNAISLELAQLELSKSKVEMSQKANAAKCKADDDKVKQERSKNYGTTSDEW